MERTVADSVPSSRPIHSRPGPSVPLNEFTDTHMSYRAMIRWDNSLFPEYNTRAERLKTYSRWPHPIAPSPDKMAEAGFFCKGNNTLIIYSMLFYLHLSSFYFYKFNVSRFFFRYFWRHCSVFLLRLPIEGLGGL